MHIATMLFFLVGLGCIALGLNSGNSRVVWGGEIVAIIAYVFLLYDTVVYFKHNPRKKGVKK